MRTPIAEKSESEPYRLVSGQIPETAQRVPSSANCATLPAIARIGTPARRISVSPACQKVRQQRDGAGDVGRERDCQEYLI